MRSLIFIFITFFSISLVAQNCKYEVDEFDDFTKERITLTSPERLAAAAGQGEIFIKASYKNNVYSFFVEQALQKQYKIAEGDEIILLFMDGSMLKLNAVEAKDVSQPEARTKIYREFVNYEVAEEVWEALKNKSVKKVRIAASGKNYDYEVLAQKAKLFAELISCVEKD